MSDIVFTAEQIKDLVELKDKEKLSGDEIMLIETPDGSNSYKTTVNTLLGFMATQLFSVINDNKAPEWIFDAKSVIIIPEGESVLRVEGNSYIKVCDSIEAQQMMSAVPTFLKVSPNMGLKVYPKDGE